MNEHNSAQVGPVWVISHERFLSVLFYLGSSHWSEVGQTQSEKGDVVYFCGDLAKFDSKPMTAVCLH